MKPSLASLMGAVALIVMSGARLQSLAAEPGEWQILKGQHFLVHYRSDKAFADETLRAAEKYYRQIAQDLGYARQDRFWLWDDRVKILIYEDRDSFVSATAAPAWASAKADYRHREISGVRDAADFIATQLPHEMAHLIFRDFVGFKDEIPQWLNEGVAMREETAVRAEAGTAVAEWARHGELIGLKDLTAMDVAHVQEPALAKRFYLQSVSLVGYMIERQGSGRFQKFCKALRDGSAMDEALRLSYGESVGNLQALEAAWKQSLAEAKGRGERGETK
jgi:hypothetical protein